MWVMCYLQHIYAPKHTCGTILGYLLNNSIWTGNEFKNGTTYGWKCFPKTILTFYSQILDSFFNKFGRKWSLNLGHWNQWEEKNRFDRSRCAACTVCPVLRSNKKLFYPCFVLSPFYPWPMIGHSLAKAKTGKVSVWEAEPKRETNFCEWGEKGPRQCEKCDRLEFSYVFACLLCVLRNVKSHVEQSDESPQQRAQLRHKAVTLGHVRI